MSKQARQELYESCQVLVAHLKKMPASRHSLRWLRDEMIDMLLDTGNQHELANDYEVSYEYADVANPYLAEVLKAYDEQ